MKANTLISLFAATCASTIIHAKDLVVLSFDGSAPDTAINSGSLPHGVIGSSGRKKPSQLSPGIGGSGSALKFTNEQTGRPDYYQSVDIASSGLDYLEAFTIALWFKSDATAYNQKNPVGSNLVTTLIDTTDGTQSSGIKVGLNKGKTGEQVYIYLSDGLNNGQGWFGFQPRFNTRDDQWTFLALTFDASLSKGRLRYFGGDEYLPAAVLGRVSNFDAVRNTGDAPNDVISIGDGQGGFANSSSHIGLIDQVYIASTALSPEEIEALRQSGLR